VSTLPINNPTYNHQTALASSARLLFASLAPSSTTLPTLALALRTWEDHLWARVCALFEDRIDVLLDRFGGFWNSTGIRSVGLGESKDVDIETNEEDDEDAFEEQIESVLKEVETVKLNSRCVFSNLPPPRHLFRLFVVPISQV
jgi:nuclear pore complex protein Nup107